MQRVKLLLGILILILVNQACSISTSETNDSPRSDLPATAIPDRVPPAARDDSQNFLIDTLGNHVTSEPFRVTAQEKMTYSTVNYLAEFQPPDRFHVMISGMVEAIMIGQSMYIVKGSWEITRMTNVFLYAQALASPGGEGVNYSISNVKFKGTEKLNKKLVLIFTCTTAAKVDRYDVTSSNQFWIGATDGRVYKVISESTGDIPSITTILFEYDPSITVNPTGQ
ncbi:MAG: hypothetical protein JW704_09960 [Anaerolineaceae bacterium]|nr:hypothetical protein [Anaerolineaceae bacterium]MBN2678317.1 hypothetical protein [Anaerolineaceae bacterium]